MKSKLIDFIKLSNNTNDDKELDKFRSLSVGVVKKKTGNRKVVEHIQKEHGFDITEKLDILNIDLKSNTKSKLFFDFCMPSEGKGIDSIKCKRDIKRKFFSLNSELGEKKFDIERKLK